MYFIVLKPKVEKAFSKLRKRLPKQLEIIFKKIAHILENPYHFKPLRGDMHGSRRGHIDSAFVLVYEIDEEHKIVRILDYDHHDKIY